MENFDIFNLGLDTFQEEQKPVSKSSEYKTDPKLSKDSVYRAIVRFVPNIKNPKKSIIKKFSYWLELNEGEGFYVDCPSSINEKSVIQDTFWKLFKSESAFDKKQAEHIKRKEYYYSYVEIVKDPQRPELEGTIQIFRYPKAVKKLIDGQIQPEATEIEMGAEPTNIFDFFNGKDFSLKVTLKGGYWNYDECKFAPATSAITINGVKMDNNAESRNQILGLYEGIQELEEFDFKPWTDDQRDRVYKFLSELTGNPGAAYNAVTSPSKTSAAPTQSAPVTNTAPAPIPSADSIMESASSQAANGSDAEIEDWLKEFDIK
jgi:hypothetical protein